jgi:hypothetical protein
MITGVLSAWPEIIAAGLVAANLVVWIRLARRWRLRRAARAVRTAPLEPAHRRGDTSWTVLLPLVRRLVQRRRAAVPVHVGATTAWSPAAEVGSVGTAPELVTAPEQMEADHHALDTIAHAQLAFGTAVEAALDAFLRDDPLTRVRLASSVESTQEINLAELRAELALAGAR